MQLVNGDTGPDHVVILEEENVGTELTTVSLTHWILLPVKEF